MATIGWLSQHALRRVVLATARIQPRGCIRENPARAVTTVRLDYISAPTPPRRGPAISSHTNAKSLFLSLTHTRPCPVAKKPADRCDSTDTDDTIAADAW